MLDRLPFYGQVLVFLAMAAAIVGVAYTVYPNIGQMRADIAQLSDEYAVKEAKIREGLARNDYKDPGWYKHPQGMVAYEWTGTAPAAARASPQAKSPVEKEFRARKPSRSHGH